MKNPDKVLCLIEDVGIRKGAEPRRIYFGDSVGEGNRDLVYKYNLKKRPFLGTTTMDPELALLSANMGKVCYKEMI
jgi:tRNA (guanine10-N2)-methyltransferase